MENITYSYTASLKKRVNCWQASYSATEDFRYLGKLMERESLLTVEDYQRMFQANGFNKEQLDIALSPLNEEKAGLLLKEVKQESWFLLHQEVFAVECPVEKQELETVLRFHVSYYRHQILSYLEKYQEEVTVTLEAVADMIEQFQEELFFLARKTVVWDVHQVVEQSEFEGMTKEEEFEKYMSDYLGTKESVYNFFSAYPVLAKLLACRLQFACDNFATFIKEILANTEAMSQQFSVQKPFRIDRFVLGKGDSHEGGKTVIEFHMNGQELIFKYKNLEIGERFNQLLHFLEEIIPEARFYKIKRITNSTCSIEEKVPYLSCSGENEVKRFYHRYGQLLAVTYWLGATDLHMDNVIACGDQPVLIDLETIIRPAFSAEKNNSLASLIEGNSVLASGLVPQKRKTSYNVAMDALSGQRQKLPYKIRQLQQSNSSDVCFELADGHMEGAQNIPLLNGRTVDYKDYRQQIIAGFKTMNEAMLQHKEQVLQQAEQLFSHVPVRLIFRDTQDYANYLMYAVHPECMSNYIERERIIANLWRTEHVSELLILEETSAMLQHDVPLFIIDSCERTITIGGEHAVVVEKSPLENMLHRMSGINQTTSRFSLLLLKESLQLLEYEKQPYLVTDKSKKQPSALGKAEAIGDRIVEELLWDVAADRLILLKVTLDEQRTPIVTYPEENLYDGLGGIYLFLLTLNHYLPKQTYKTKLEQLERQIFNNRGTEIYQGVCSGLGMKLLLDFFAMELLQDQRYEERLLENLCRLSERETIGSGEWLCGSAGLASLLSEIYRYAPYPIVKELLEQHTTDFVLEKELDSSFAHGYAGILYSLERINEILPTFELQRKIGQCRFMLLNTLAKEDVHNLSWCRGALGLEKAMGVGVQELLQLDERLESLDDCLCHGLAGILARDELLDSHLMDSDCVYLSSDRESLPLDLFTGISGIGYRFLQESYGNEIRSILFFD